MFRTAYAAASARLPDCVVPVGCKNLLLQHSHSPSTARSPVGPYCMLLKFAPLVFVSKRSVSRRRPCVGDNPRLRRQSRRRPRLRAFRPRRSPLPRSPLPGLPLSPKGASPDGFACVSFAEVRDRCGGEERARLAGLTTAAVDYID